MKLGITGTQDGMTAAQHTAVREQIQSFGPVEFHHGCCIGVDYEAHLIAYDLNIPIVYHPPINHSKMADFSQYKGIWREEKEYLVRNKDIVNETGHLLVVPKGYEEEVRSGTWSTKRYAEKVDKIFTIVYPDGSTKCFFPVQMSLVYYNAEVEADNLVA